MILRKSWASALLLFGLVTAPAHAGTDARIYGTVTDENGDPVANATITVTTEQLGTFKEVWTTNKKGRYRALIGDATMTYTFTVEKAGYRPTVEEHKLELEATEKRDFVLYPGTSSTPAPAPAPSNAPESASNAAIRLYNEGAEALRAEDYATARDRMRQALEKDPELGQAHAVLALALVRLGEHQEAVTEAERALELRPGDSTALQARYDAYRALGDTAKAEEAGEALAAAGQNADAAKTVYNEGVELTRAGDREAAIKSFEDALRLDPTLTPASDALAGLYYAVERYQDAASAAERVLKEDPGNLKALKVRYQSYRALKDESKAQDALVALAAVDPEVGVDAFYNQGVSFFNAGQTPQAVAAFQQALAVDPDHAMSHFNLALCYVNTSDNAQAKTHFERFLELSPDSAEAATAREMIQYLN